MILIDEHDAAERDYQAALHGIDTTKKSAPARSSNQTVGLDAFYRMNWAEGAKFAEVEL